MPGRPACHGQYTETFFEPGSVATAKKICSTCPVKDACLREAVRLEAANIREHPYLFGVFGGLTAKERAPLVYAAAGLRA